MANITMETSQHDDVDVVRVAGQLDTSAAPAFEARLIGLVEAGTRQIAIDCTHLTLVTSAGLRVLLAVSRRLRALDGEIVICSVSGNVRDVIEISGFGAFLPILPTLAAALERS